MTFISSLRGAQSIFVPPESSEALDVYNSVLTASLGLAVTKWDEGIVKAGKRSVNTVRTPWESYSAPPETNPSQTQEAARIVELLELGITLGDAASCKTLLKLVLQSTTPANLHDKISALFDILVPKIHRLLSRHKLDATAFPPIHHFLKVLISSYLSGVLGARNSSSQHPLIRNVGCGCADCKELQHFLASSRSQECFRLVQNRRQHLEQHLRAIPKLCGFALERYGRPHGLRVQKTQFALDVTVWEYRQKAAKNFLAKFGSDADVAAIMGSRYTDVRKALDGSQPFVQTTPQPNEGKKDQQPAWTSRQTTATKTPDHVERDSTPEIVEIPNPVTHRLSSTFLSTAGVKRKQPDSEVAGNARAVQRP